MVCVKHRGGWCATYKRTTKYGDSIRTLCSYYVILPFNIKERKPDCPECLQKIKERNNKK